MRKIGFEIVGLSLSITYLLLLALIEILNLIESNLVGLLQEIVEVMVPAIMGFMAAWALIRIIER
jgi:uncharacterized RDD family membrane protein YckC